MRKLKLVIILALISSCNEYEQKSDRILGDWVQSDYSKSYAEFSRVDSLTLNNFGFQLASNNHLIRIQPVGFCGTEPINFEKVEGEWAMTSDTTFFIEYEFWLGIGRDDFQIINLNDSLMVLKLLDHTVVKI